MTSRMFSAVFMQKCLSLYGKHTRCAGSAVKAPSLCCGGGVEECGCGRSRMVVWALKGSSRLQPVLIRRGSAGPDSHKPLQSQAAPSAQASSRHAAFNLLGGALSLLVGGSLLLLKKVEEEQPSPNLCHHGLGVEELLGSHFSQVGGLRLPGDIARGVPRVDERSPCPGFDAGVGTQASHVKADNMARTGRVELQTGDQSRRTESR